jgi:hypothetical protein
MSGLVFGDAVAQAQQGRIDQAYAQTPLIFEPNVGQASPGVDFVARGTGYVLQLADGNATLSIPAANGHAGLQLQLGLVGANRAATAQGEQPLTSRSNYLTGDASQWLTGVANYQRVQYASAYPGIDLVYYGNQRQLEYDFVVSPGGDPSQIAYTLSGSDSLSIDQSGDLVLQTPLGNLVQHAPVTYQLIDGVRRDVASYYVLDGEKVSFALGPYDHSQALIIDPVVLYSTYLGGSLGDKGLAIAVDAAGNAYVTGETGSSEFPTTAGAYDRTIAGGNTLTDAFVTKFNPNGQLVYSTYLGGWTDDHGTAIAVDAAGNAYVGGWTSSSNFPTTAGAFQTTFHGADCFVTKLNASGSGIVYSTFLGGNASQFIGGIAVNTAGNAFVTGDTTSTDFPTKNPIQPGISNTMDDAFLTKLNPTGTALVYSTYLRGTGDDLAHGVAVDSSGNAIVVGETTSGDFPTTPTAFDPSYTPVTAERAAFITKVNQAGTGFIYSTYLHGDVDDVAYGVAVDSFGNAYVTGETFAENYDFSFPTSTDAALRTPNQGDNGLSDAFVTKFAPGGGLVYSTRIGGGGRNTTDRGTAIAVDAGGNAYITGIAKDTSTAYPTRRAFQPISGGNSEAFVTRINSAGTDWDYSSLLGGNSVDEGNGIAVDANGYAYVVGTTRTLQGTTNNFPTKNAIKSQGPAEFDEDAFVVRIRPYEDGAGQIQFPQTTFWATESGGEAQIYVRRFNGTTKTATVHYATADGTAKAGSDYKATSGTLTFNPGEFEKMVRIPLLNDSLNEGLEQFKVTLSSPTGGATLMSPTTTTIDVIDDDHNVFNDNFVDRRVIKGTTASVTGNNTNATFENFEPNDAGKSAGASLWWTWTAPATGLVTIDTIGSSFDTVLGVYWYRRYVENNDVPGRFDGASAVTFNARLGETYTISVDGNVDAVTSRGSIKLNLNLIPRGIFVFSAAQYSVNEGAGTATITVKRNGGSTGAAYVQYWVTNGTAKAATDFTATKGTLTFAAGQTVKTFTVKITNDTLAEPTETINLRLNSATGGAILGTPYVATLKIIDNDSAGAVATDAYFASLLADEPATSKKK